MHKIAKTIRPMTVNSVRIAEETILRTRQYFVDLLRRCIADAQSGATRVNNVAPYVEWRENAIAAVLAGEDDHTLAFMQRAYFLQTGESVPLLTRP